MQKVREYEDYLVFAENTNDAADQPFLVVRGRPNFRDLLQEEMATFFSKPVQITHLWLQADGWSYGVSLFVGGDKTGRSCVYKLYPITHRKV